MTWVLYAALIGLLVTVAAEAVHQVLLLRGCPTRWVWSAAMVLSIALPGLLPLLPRATPEVQQFPVTITAAPISASDIPVAAPVVSSMPSTSTLLMMAWGAALLLLLVYLVVATLRLSMMRRRWRATELHGESVLVAPALGPAVIGILRPAIVVPEWFATLPVRAQTIALAHEREHIRARDPLVITATRVLPALLPWNVALWYQHRRLRQSVELDCDARVLKSGLDANSYAELLITVGEFVSSGPALIAALAEPAVYSSCASSAL